MQVNNKLEEHIVYLERQRWINFQYSILKCLEISVTPDENDQKDLDDKALNIFRKLDVEIDFSNIEDFRWLPSKGPNRVIVKFSKRKDANRTCHCKKILKGMSLTSFGISSPVFINDRFFQYYKIF